MSEAESDLADLIARARGDAPGPERLAGVRARLEARLGPLDAPPPQAPAIGAKGALGVAALAVVIAIAAWLGTRPGEVPSTSVSLPEREVAPAPEPEPEPEPEPTAPAVATEEEVSPPEAPVVEEERPARRAPAAEEADLDPASTLREEIALLDRALRAREAGDPARALAALREHRRRFPEGRLAPERDAMLDELRTEEAVPATP